MITEKMFLKVVELVLNEISDTTYHEHSSIISGKEKWEPRKWGIFENSFTERIVRRLSFFEDVIGWEVSYPSDVFCELGSSKLDLAYGHIDDYYFETIVEIKKWDGDDKSQYYIWQDIFKLFAYETNNSINVGNNKYALVLYNHTSACKGEIRDLINHCFLNPSKNSLYYDTDDLLEAFNRLLIDFKWSRKSIDSLFSKYKNLFSGGQFIEFKEEYLMNDVGENVFAFVLKLKS